MSKQSNIYSFIMEKNISSYIAFYKAVIEEKEWLFNFLFGKDSDDFLLKEITFEGNDFGNREINTSNSYIIENKHQLKDFLLYYYEGLLNCGELVLIFCNSNGLAFKDSYTWGNNIVRFEFKNIMNYRVQYRNSRTQILPERVYFSETAMILNHSFYCQDLLGNKDFKNKLKTMHNTYNTIDISYLFDIERLENIFQNKINNYNYYEEHDSFDAGFYRGLDDSPKFITYVNTNPIIKNKNKILVRAWNYNSECRKDLSCYDYQFQEFQSKILQCIQR